MRLFAALTIGLGLSLCAAAATSAAAAEDPFAEYERQFLAESQQLPENPAFIGAYAHAKAKRARTGKSRSTLVVETGTQTTNRGDVNIGGLLVQPGGAVNVNQIIINGRSGNLIVAPGGSQK